MTKEAKLQEDTGAGVGAPGARMHKFTIYDNTGIPFQNTKQAGLYCIID